MLHVSFPGVCSKTPQATWLTQEGLISASSGGGTSEMKVSRGLVSPGTSLLGSEMPIYPLRLSGRVRPCPDALLPPPPLLEASIYNSVFFVGVRDSGWTYGETVASCDSSSITTPGYTFFVC